MLACTPGAASITSARIRSEGGSVRFQATENSTGELSSATSDGQAGDFDNGRAPCGPSRSFNSSAGSPGSIPRTSQRRLNWPPRSEEHTSELQSHVNLVCRLLLEKKKLSTHVEHKT